MKNVLGLAVCVIVTFVGRLAYVTYGEFSIDRVTYALHAEDFGIYAVSSVQKSMLGVAGCDFGETVAVRGTVQSSGGKSRFIACINPLSSDSPRLNILP
jgi:hypothetical protein